MPTILQTWIPYLYLYGVGGIFFTIGMIIIRRSKAIDLRRKRHIWWYKMMYAGFFYFMFIHALFTLIALYF